MQPPAIACPLTATTTGFGWEEDRFEAAHQGRHELPQVVHPCAQNPLEVDAAGEEASVSGNHHRAARKPLDLRHALRHCVAELDVLCVRLAVLHPQHADLVPSLQIQHLPSSGSAGLQLPIATRYSWIPACAGNDEASHALCESLLHSSSAVPWFGGRQIAAISRQDVQRWFASLRATLVAADRSAPNLSVILKETERIGHRPQGSNPCRGIRRCRREGRERYLSEEKLRGVARRLSAHQGERPLQGRRRSPPSRLR